MAADKNDLWTVLRMLEWATDYFKEKDIPDPRHSIEWLLAEVLGCKRLDLYLAYERPLSPKELEQLRPLIKRRAGNEPLQYIIGYTDFMNCRIEVNSSALIPRIETEQLVELLLDKTSHLQNKSMNLLDIGTGTGCIPLAIKQEMSAWNCFGTDISEEALSLARKNAEINSLDASFFKSNLFQLNNSDASDISWDIIISNPPYIETGDRQATQTQVSEYEPAIALFHDEPLSVYRAITTFSHQNSAALFLELNDKIANDILAVVSRSYSGAKMYKDLDNNSRFIHAL